MKRRRSQSRKLPLGVAAVVLLLVLGGGSRLVTGASGAGGGTRDDDERGCTLSSLKGPYAYHVTGSAQAPSGTEGADIAAVGRVVSDGKGHVTGHDWASTNGATTARTVTGTYTLDPDCTGMVHLVFTPGGPGDAFFVLTDRGRVLKTIQTNPGTVISGDGVRE
jgi:hypothetical protein